MGLSPSPRPCRRWKTPCLAPLLTYRMLCKCLGPECAARFAPHLLLLGWRQEEPSNRGLCLHGMPVALNLELLRSRMAWYECWEGCIAGTNSLIGHRQRGLYLARGETFGCPLRRPAKREPKDLLLFFFFFFSFLSGGVVQWYAVHVSRYEETVDCVRRRSV
jgi:hypothetical protein